MTINPTTQYTLSGSQLTDLRDYVKAAMESPSTLLGSTAPSSSTAADVGQLYLNTTNDKVYICTAKTSQGGTPETFTYTWEEVGNEVSDVQVAGTSVVSDGVANIDYASASKVGVIRTNTDYGTSVTSVGALISATKTYQQYQDTTTPNMFISKGTLENVITGKGLVDQTDLATKQDVLTAGTGISITNGVISCTFANGNGVSY